MNNYIEQLALQKDFTELNAEEQTAVLLEMSEHAYGQWRQLLLSARTLEADATPPARLRTHLQARMAQKARPKGIRRWLTAPIQAWQAAAMLALGVAAVFFLPPPKPAAILVDKWHWQVDTVFQEKTVWRDRILIKNQIVYRDRPMAPPMVYIEAGIDSTALIPVFQPQEWQETHVGTSLNDTPELLEFFTTEH